VAKRRKPRLRMGATKKFPQGKLNQHDEGEIQFAVSHDHAHVRLDFGTPVAWLGMEPSLARALAGNLIKHAEAVESKAH